MIRPRSSPRYPIIWVAMEDLDYYWGATKIRGADYKNYLLDNVQELELAKGSDPELARLAESIKRKGLVNPLIITIRHGRLYVIVGCQRLAVLRQLRWKKLVPCRIAPDFDEEIVLDVHPYKEVKLPRVRKP